MEKIVLLLIIICSSVYAEKASTEIKIEGAFGYKLGEVYNIKPNQLIMMHRLTKPRKPFRKFNFYDISVDPKQRIFLIRAQFTAKTEIEAIQEIQILEKAIEKKYKAKPLPVEGADKNIYFVGIENKTQNRSIGIVRSKNHIRIMYRDHIIGKAQSEAEKEKREQETKRSIEEAQDIL